MGVQTFFHDLQSRGFVLVMEGENLRVTPASKLTVDDRQAIKRFKVEIIALLAQPKIKPEPAPTTTSPSGQAIDHPPAAVSLIEPDREPTKKTDSIKSAPDVSDGPDARAEAFLKRILPSTPGDWIEAETVNRKARKAGIPEIALFAALNRLDIERKAHNIEGKLTPVYKIPHPYLNFESPSKAAEIAPESPVGEDSARGETNPTATGASISAVCPICKGALTIEEGENYRHLFCSTPGHYDSWAHTQGGKLRDTGLELFNRGEAVLRRQIQSGICPDCSAKKGPEWNVSTLQQMSLRPESYRCVSCGWRHTF